MINDQIGLGLLILVIGFAVVLPLVYWWSTRQPRTREQGRIRASGRPPRIEPVMGADGADQPSRPGAGPDGPDQPADDATGSAGDGAGAGDDDTASVPAAGQDVDGQAPEGGGSDDPVPDLAALPEAARSEVGARPNQSFDRIVSLFVRARGGHLLRGDDVMVVAEKVGLVYGNMGIFHRLVDGREKDGPVFSMANIAKPGSFDIRQMSALETPGLSFFMTLPGPMPALDAWNTLLPVAQRVAQLLDADLLDESRNPLVEQAIGFIRNEMRQYDREQDKHNIRPGR